MRLCLNMIVKDEAHVIEESLNLLKNYICYWVISDTGSTDDTKNIIKNFFKREKIRGHLVEHKWKDFGTNRTLALESCYKHRKNFDYIWVFDADDLIIGNLTLPTKPKADMYNLIYGQGFTYWRGQIFKSSLKWKYVGVLHEFPECTSKQNPTRENINGDYYIDSRRIGNRNKAEDKYERDAKVLEQGLIDEPNNERYMFYLGQSYMDARNYDKAIEWYTKRADRGGWIEEVYYSLYRVATCMQYKNMPWEDVEKAYIKAWKSLPSRVDPLYEIAKYYRLTDNYEKAYTYAKQGSKIPYPADQYLFLFREIYEYKILDELSMDSYYVGKYEESFENCNKLLRKDLPTMDRNRIENNRDMCIQHIINNYITYPVKQIVNIKNNKKKLSNGIIFTITTSSLDLFNKTINSFLNCCLDYHKIDKWICVNESNSPYENNLSADDIDTIKKLYPFFEYKIQNNSDILMEGYIKNYKYWIHMDSDWQYFEKRNYIDECFNILSCDSSYGQVLFNKNYAENASGRHIAGGILVQNQNKQRYYVHEYHPKNTPEYEDFIKSNLGQSNRVYWPHYSVRPSMMKVSVMLTVERVENETKLEYATRYTNMGYKSTFLDTICCNRIKDAKHKDTFTVETFTDLFKSDDIWIEIKGKDSYGYDLGPPINGDIDFMKAVALQDDNCMGFNNLGYLKSMIVPPDKWINVDYPGFSMYVHKTRYDEYYKTFSEIGDKIINSDKPMKSFVINLERRKDRKEYITKIFNEAKFSDYEFYEAVDGTKISMTPEINKLFEGNDFNWRRGILGASLSHYNLWQKLSQSDDEFYCIFEDDIRLNTNFTVNLNRCHQYMIRHPNVDMILLGYSMFTYLREKVRPIYDVPLEEVSIHKHNSTFYIGGHFGYICSKNFVSKMINYIKINGIKRCIDSVMLDSKNVNIYECQPCLVYADWVTSTNSIVDSDTQKDFNSIDLNTDNNQEVLNNKTINLNTNNNQDLHTDNTQDTDKIISDSEENKIISDSQEVPNTLYIDAYNFEEAYILFDKINTDSLSIKEQFMFYDLLSTVCWNTGRKEEAIEICQHIIQLAKTNSSFADLVNIHYNRLNDKFNGFAKGISKATTNYKGDVVIVGLGNIFGDWDPSSIKTGLPGSEEAIVYGAQALADLGYRVVVYSLPPPKSIYSLKLSNPEYRRIETLNNDMNNKENKEHYDVAFIWRQYNIDHYISHNLADKYLLWLHDLCYGRNVFQTIPPNTEILWLSEFHRSSFLPSNPLLNKPNYIKTFGNGIVPSQFSLFNLHRKNKYSCIYASNYARGLKILLDIWIEIKTKYPESTLDIYYGWQTWGTITPQEEEQLKVKVIQLEKYDVREHGQIGHEELAQKMKQTSFWTYPCTFAETFCITGIKAQAAGCVPIIVESAALLETVKYGYKTNNINNYKQLLFDAFDKVDEWTLTKREEMSKWAIENHSWKNVATKWAQEFK